MLDKKIVIIPTYNERDNVEEMALKVLSLQPEFDVLFVDDGSPDGTGDIIQLLEERFKGRVFLIERNGKLGLGTAYIIGFKWALGNSYKYIFEMDCDFSHNPEDLPRLLSEAEIGSDVVIGSRYIKNGGFINWPLIRILISRIASIYVNLITCMRIADPTSGFICYRRNVLEAMDLDSIRCVGYAFQVEMKFLIRKLGFKIKEIPIIFTDRLKGSSKMSGHIVKEGVVGVIVIQWNYFLKHMRKL